MRFFALSGVALAADAARVASAALSVLADTLSDIVHNHA